MSVIKLTINKRTLVFWGLPFDQLVSSTSDAETVKMTGEDDG